ncbi:Crp/Fnr family transcriptional regulator [Mycobacterium sp. KBS0706]|nr:Crp/Fnr family transcriptional regulator [Mycobacterium sp. KBS0706]
MVAGVLRLLVPATRSALEDCHTCEARCRSLCGSVSDEHLTEFADIAETVRLRPHQRIVTEGDPADHTFNIVSGAAKLVKALPDGRQQIVGFLLCGDFFGLPVQGAYPYGVEAIGEARLCRFERTRFEALLRRLPAVETALRERLIGDLASAQEHMLSLGQKSALERLTGFLLQLSGRAGGLGLSSNPVQLPMTRADIADYLGLTLETVSRSFGRLRDQGLIAVRGRHEIALEAIDRLKELAQGDDETVRVRPTEGEPRCRSAGY